GQEGGRQAFARADGIPAVLQAMGRSARGLPLDRGCPRISRRMGRRDERDEGGMIDPAVLDAMLAAGCTADQIVAAVKADAQAEREREEARREAKRAGNAERQRRHRERNALSRVTGVTNSDTPSPAGFLSPEPPILPNPQPSKKKSPKGDQNKGTPQQAPLTAPEAQRPDTVLEQRP